MERIRLLIHVFVQNQILQLFQVILKNIKIGNGIQLFGLVIFGFNIFNFTLWAILKLKLDILNAFNSFENLMKEQKKKEQFEPKNPLLLTLPTEVIKMMEQF